MSRLLRHPSGSVLARSATLLTVISSQRRMTEAQTSNSSTWPLPAMRLTSDSAESLVHCVLVGTALIKQLFLLELFRFEDRCGGVVGGKKHFAHFGRARRHTPQGQTDLSHSGTAVLGIARRILAHTLNKNFGMTTSQEPKAWCQISRDQFRSSSDAATNTSDHCGGHCPFSAESCLASRGKCSALHLSSADAPTCYASGNSLTTGLDRRRSGDT